MPGVLRRSHLCLMSSRPPDAGQPGETTLASSGVNASTWRQPASTRRCTHVHPWNRSSPRSVTFAWPCDPHERTSREPVQPHHRRQHRCAQTACRSPHDPPARERRRRPGPIVAKYYEQRTGIGLLVTEGVFPSAESKAYPGQPGIVTDEQAAGWAKVADAVR